MDGQTEKLKVTAPSGATKILLHTCCAPCSSAIVECLLHSGIDPVIYYYNPNIYPLQEYEIRKNECSRYARSLGLEVVDADYDHDAWLSQVKGLENEPERGARCDKCFAIRFDKACEYAAEHGLKVVATTLGSSRWKNLEHINLAGEAASQRHNVIWWGQNWRKGGLQERRSALIKEYDFYNQLYCGCEFSM